MNLTIKSSLTIAFVSLLFVVPFQSHAQPASAPSTDSPQYIALLEQLLTLLEQELASIEAQQPAVTPNSTTPTSPSANYETYTPVAFTEYQDDSAAYTGEDITLSGMNDAFIPSTGSGSTNYVEVENPFDPSQPKIELEVDDAASYSALVNALQDKSDPIHLFLRAYGTSVPSQSFTSSNLFRSATVQLPVLDVSRVDQCEQGSMNTTVVSGTSFENNFSCSSWSTIIPASSAGTIYSTPVPISTPTQPSVPTTPVTTPTSNPSPAPALSSDATLQNLTVNGTTVAGFNPTTYSYTVTLPAGSAQAPTVAAVVNNPNAKDIVNQAIDSLGVATVYVTAQNDTTENTYTIHFEPSDAGQCNVGGDIFTCASDSGIAVSPTSLPNATVGESYSEPVSVTDPDTTSPDFRWNIISGQFPPGLDFVFGNAAITCSGTYCSFTTAPSGVSATNPGTFFGTPTTAGTYSFTLQGIDSLNYVTLTTFTLTIASSTSE